MEEIIKEMKLKKKIVFFKEEILLSSTVEDACTVNLNKYEIKIEKTEIQGTLYEV